MTEPTVGATAFVVRPNGDSTVEWMTPPEILSALGPFDLDPCAHPLQPWPTAAQMIAPPEDGRMLPWRGRVWLNPPYGPQETWHWMERLAAHGNGIALIFARTETEGFWKWVWNCADAVLFVRGRVFFHYPSGERAPTSGGSPSCLVAYGAANVAALERCQIPGALVFGSHWVRKLA